MIIAANKIDVKGARENYERIKKEFPELIIIPTCAEAELALKEANKAGLIKYLPGNKDFKKIKEMNEQQEKALEYIKKEVLEKNEAGTGVQEIINKAVFELLGMIAVWPGGVNKLADKDGNILPDVFLLKKGSTALDFAYKIHTDIGKHFIRAIHVPSKRTIGKDYELKNRDEIEIITDK